MSENIQKKLVVVAEGFPVISETFVVDQITGLLESGHDLEIWAFFKPDQARVHADVEKYGLLGKVRYLQLPGQNLAPRDWLHSFYEINEVVTAENTLAVHCHFGPSFLRLMPIFRCYPSLRTTVSFYGYDVFYYPAANGESCYAYLFERADSILANTGRIKDRLISLGCPQEKLKIHRTGVQLERFCGAEAIGAMEGVPGAFLTIARFVEKKGLEYSLRAFSIIARESTWEYRIVGDGPLKNELMNLVHQLGIEDRVTFLGMLDRDSCIEQMKNAAVFVLSSVTASNGDCEGLPVCLIEAQALGLPVISSVHSGIPELIHHGRNGYLAGERDVETLAKYMRELMDSSSLRKQFAERGQETVAVEYDLSRLNGDLSTILTGPANRSAAVGEADVGAVPTVKISIVIPTYNRVDYLAQAIESALAQEGDGFEVLVIDDGSTDGSLEMLQKIRSPRLRFIAKEHSGAPATRNCGIQEARGDFILWLDSDDVLQQNVLKRYSELVTDYPEVDVVYGNLIVTNEQLQQINFLCYRDWYGSEKELIGELLRICAIPNPGTLVRKKVYELFGGYDEAYPRAHDYEFWTRIVGQTKFKKADLAVVKWRWHDSNMSSGTVEKDTSYDACAVKKMLTRFSLEQIFPGKAWSERPRHQVEAIAYLLVAKRLLELKDYKGAHEMAHKSLVRFQSQEASELLKLAENTLQRMGETEYDTVEKFRYIKKDTAHNSHPNPSRHIHTDRNDILRTGEEYFEWGNFAAAEISFNKILQQNPDDVEALNNLGVLAFHQGQPDEARKYFELCLRIAPSFIEAAKNLALYDLSQKVEGWVHPKVSVIVPTYNRPEMLREALQSILAQSYHDFEIIVINDAGAPVEDLITPLNVEGRITYVRHPLNQGIAAARNTGIRNARGKYVAYLDDDDIFYPHHLETLVNYLESSGNKIAYTDAYRGHQVKKDDRWVVARRDVPYSSDFDPDKILVHNFVPTLCVMHERSILDETGGFDENLNVHEDWELWLRISREHNPYHIKQLTCEFRSRPDKSSLSGGPIREFYNTCLCIYDKYSNWVADKPLVRKAQEANLVNYQVNQALELSKGVDDLTMTIRRLEELLVSWPQMGTIHNALGYLHAQAANRPKAIKHLKEAVRLEPNSELYRKNLSIVVSSIDITDKESKAKKYLEKGEQAFSEGDFELAILYFGRLLEVDENNLDALNNLGVVAFRQGRVDEARRFFKRCLQIKQGFDEARQNLKMCEAAPEPNVGELAHGIEGLLRWGEALFSEGNLDGASDCFLQILNQDAGQIEALNNMGVVAVLAGQSEDALAFVDKALAINPYFLQALENRSVILRRFGLYRDAEAVEDLLSAVRSDVEKLIAIGEASFASGDIEKASQAFKGVLAFDPNHAEAINNLGVLAFHAGDLEEARRLWNRCLEIDSGCLEARQNLSGLKEVNDENRPSQPRFSVITCSIDMEKLARLKESLKVALKDFEIIHIADASSLAEGYNRGIAQAAGTRLIFCHDDIEFLTPGLDDLLEEDLASFDFVGVAGTTRLVEGNWIAAGQPYIHGQVAHLKKNSEDESYNICLYGMGYDPEVVEDIQALDGLFIAARREALDGISFDEESFDGFHLYDLDLTYGAFLKGRRIAVDHRIHLLHASGGNYDNSWRRYVSIFNSKYSKHLSSPPSNRMNGFQEKNFNLKEEVLEEMRRYGKLHASLRLAN